MGHLFFEAWATMSKAQAVTAAYADGITTLPITSSGVGVFGLWGNDPKTGATLRIIVYRGGIADGQAYSGGTIVNEGPNPAVQVKLILEVANASTRIYRATGLRPGDVIYGAAPALHYVGPLTVVQVTGTAAGVMRDWANRLRDDPSYRPTDPFLCSIATPYLALTKGAQTPIVLADGLVGGPMTAVHGLSVHTTGGGGNRDAFDTAIYGCVHTWNTNMEASGFIAAAHFAISSDGVIVQIVPTNRIAWAQGNPGDNNWISVEVDNDGTKPMSTAQVAAVRRLFGWVCTTYPVPRRLATGTLYYKKGQPPWKKTQDELTTKACEDGGAPTTEVPFTAAFARGLSCHYWLDARNGKPCPGVGILGQMAEIAKP